VHDKLHGVGSRLLCLGYHWVARNKNNLANQQTILYLGVDACEHINRDVVPSGNAIQRFPLGNNMVYVIIGSFTFRGSYRNL